MVQDFLRQPESCRKVLVQTVEADLQSLGTLGDAEVASQLVESLLDGRNALLVGSDIVEILGCIAVADIILIAELVAEYEVEEVVLGVLLVYERQLPAGLSYGKVLLEIEELRLDFTKALSYSRFAGIGVMAGFSIFFKVVSSPMRL